MIGFDFMKISRLLLIGFCWCGHLPAADLRLEAGKIFRDEDSRPAMSFSEAAGLAAGAEQFLEVSGSYSPPSDAQGGKFKGGGVGPSPAYSYSAQAVELTVDTHTGEITVDRIVAAHDCGKAINPLAVEGQVEGSVWMGLGQALQEEMLWENGRLMNTGLLEYHSASTLESPPIEPMTVSPRLVIRWPWTGCASPPIVPTIT